MKKIYKSFILFVCLFLSVKSFAVTHTIAVSNNQFTPASLNVNVGDTIMWTWTSGFHTTTSQQIPLGAATWNSQMTSTVTTFSYPVTVEGTYDYDCTIHFFTGQFVALNTGISSPNNYYNFNFYSLRPSTYVLSYTLIHSADVKITLYDITGRSVRAMNYSSQVAGNYLNTYSFEDLQKGIYLFELFIGNYRITKRLIIE